MQHVAINVTILGHKVVSAATPAPPLQLIEGVGAVQLIACVDQPGASAEHIIVMPWQLNGDLLDKVISSSIPDFVYGIQHGHSFPLKHLRIEATHLTLSSWLPRSSLPAADIHISDVR